MVGEDVVEAVRALKPGIIRFGSNVLDDGKLDEFDWRDAIGDSVSLNPFRDGVDFSRPELYW